MTQTILEMKDLGFSVNQQEILSGITLDITKGDLITISGPSGSGKSTLLKIIGGMASQTSGAITYKGKNITDYPTTQYRKDVSYFFQSPVLFGETVKDNLAFPSEIREETFDENRATELLSAVKLSKDYLTKDIHSLSGGEKQRIAFIRNLMYLPNILLLDEITSALDDDNREIIHTLINDLNTTHHCTILWVTHNQEEYLSSNKRLYINEGRIQEAHND